MAAYRSKRRQPRVPRRIWWLIIALIIAVAGGTLLARRAYDSGLQPVNSSQQTQIFKVDKGSSVKQIATKLEAAHLIRSAWAFQLYVHSKELTNQLQAGTYAFSPSEGTKRIVAIMTDGQVSTKLVTILPGRRIDQVRADLINDGFKPADVDAALNPEQYSDLPALAFKPADVDNLEGLLWPDSWSKDATTPPSTIIRESLVAMGQHLTPDVQAAFAAQGLTTYQGLVLSSMVLQEVNRTADQPPVAQVFLSRLKSDIALGSDSSTKYGAIKAGQSPNLNYDSPYNTHLHKGLPPTPIGTVDGPSLAAAIHPAATNYLFFVSGDDGTTYFSTNLKDHEALTQEHCHRLCSQ